MFTRTLAVAAMTACLGLAPTGASSTAEAGIRVYRSGPTYYRSYRPSYGQYRYGSPYRNYGRSYYRGGWYGNRGNAFYGNRYYGRPFYGNRSGIVVRTPGFGFRYGW